MMDNAKKKTRNAKIKAVLTAIASCGNISKACREAGIEHSQYYDWIHKDPDLKARHDEALDQALDAIEQKVYQRAFDQSDRLCEWLLSRRRPEKYGDKIVAPPEQKPINISISLDEQKDSK